MFNAKDKKTAQILISNQDFVELLAKVFLNTEDKLTSEVVMKKNNEELGEIVRANALAEDKVRHRFDLLKRLGAESGGRSKVVPK